MQKQNIALLQGGLIPGKDCILFYKNIDFLTVKLSQNQEFLKEIDGLVNNNDTCYLDIENLKVRYIDTIAKGQLKIFHLLSKENEILAFIHIYHRLDGKKNKNFSTDIEFVGLFWYRYRYLFPYLCELLAIDCNKKNIVTRIDCCFDFLGVSVDDIKDRQLNKNIEGSVKTFNGRTTWYRLANDRHEIAIYDKKRQILKEGKYKQIVNGIQIFKSYINESAPITRLEFRKKARALRELADNSINNLFVYIQNMSIDYNQKHFDINIKPLLSDFQKLPRIPLSNDLPFMQDLDKKASLSLGMASSYLQTYALLKSETVLFGHLYNLFGKRIIKYFIDLDNRIFLDNLFGSESQPLTLKQIKEKYENKNNYL